MDIVTVLSSWIMYRGQNVALFVKSIAKRLLPIVLQKMIAVSGGNE